MKALRKYSLDFFHLFFPDLCISCLKNPKPKTGLFCFPCLYELAPCDTDLVLEENLKEKFWGRLKIEHAAALFLFYEGSKAQQLIHRIKYQNRRDIAFKLGKYFGQKLAKSSFSNDIDCIIPVPLHQKKLIKRGFNQSEEMANGLSETMQLPVLTNILRRKIDTGTQTKKTRLQRMQNIQNAFVLSNSGNMQGKHVLLVDDVVTTGATLEYSALCLKEIDQLKISIAVLGMATN